MFRGRVGVPVQEIWLVDADDAALDHPKADATAAMNGDPSGLSMTSMASSSKNRQINPLLGASSTSSLGLSAIRIGRDAQIVAGAQPIGGIDPPAIHPHFTTTQNAVDVLLGTPLQRRIKNYPGAALPSSSITT